MTAVRFAITYTVKNEARLLRSAIQYHLAAGCSRVYLFWDGTTDGAQDLVAEFPEVIARNSMAPEELCDPPAWISEILPSWQADMDVRKRINTYHAARSAAREGIEWLASLDPDELILMDRAESIDTDHVTKRLEQVPERIDQLLLPNLEAVPTSAESAEPFADCLHFLSRFPATEWMWRYSRVFFTRILKSPKLTAWYDYVFYQIRFSGALPRLMREPRTKGVIPATYFLGYINHKSFIRVRSHENFNFITHGWYRFLRAPRNMRAGNVLHFDMLDAAYLAAKYRQRPLEFITVQKSFYVRYRFALIARESSFDEIKDFFEKNIAVCDPERIALLKKRGIVVEIHSVSDAIKQIRDRERQSGRVVRTAQ